jgi:hypothetical protein
VSDRGTEAWPPDVEPISLEELGRLGIGPGGQLFWDGRSVEVRRRLVLSTLQRFVATVVTICAVLGGLGGFVTGMNNLSIFLCARGIRALSCPSVDVSQPPAGHAAR